MDVAQGAIITNNAEVICERPLSFLVRLVARAFFFLTCHNEHEGGEACECLFGPSLYGFANCANALSDMPVAAYAVGVGT